MAKLSSEYYGLSLSPTWNWDSNYTCVCVCAHACMCFHLRSSFSLSWAGNGAVCLLLENPGLNLSCVSYSLSLPSPFSLSFSIPETTGWLKVKYLIICHSYFLMAMPTNKLYDQYWSENLQCHFCKLKTKMAPIRLMLLCSCCIYSCVIIELMSLFGINLYSLLFYTLIDSNRTCMFYMPMNFIWTWQVCAGIAVGFIV